MSKATLVAGQPVTYHNEGGRQVVFALLNQNTDGTVDIGPEGGKPVVTGVHVADAPTVGCVTLQSQPIEHADSHSEDPTAALMKLTVKDLKAKAEELKIEEPGHTKAELVANILSATQPE